MKYPREKIPDPRRHHEAMVRGPQDPRWHKTNGIYHT